MYRKTNSKSPAKIFYFCGNAEKDPVHVSCPNVSGKCSKQVAIRYQKTKHNDGEMTKRRVNITE